MDLVKNYVSKIQELEQELVRLQHSSRIKRDGFHDFDSDDDVLSSKNDYLANLSELSSESDAKEMAGKVVAWLILFISSAYCLYMSCISFFVYYIISSLLSKAACFQMWK